MIYGSVPPSLVRAIVDQYGPAGLFPGGEAPHPNGFSLLHLLRRFRPTPKAAPQAERAPCYCPEPSR
jgi:hypothetical protein